MRCVAVASARPVAVPLVHFVEGYAALDSGCRGVQNARTLACRLSGVPVGNAYVPSRVVSVRG